LTDRTWSATTNLGNSLARPLRSEEAFVSTTILVLGSVFLGWPGDPPAARSTFTFPYEIALQVARVEGIHREIVSRPLESWNLEQVQQGYEALLRKGLDPRTEKVLKLRLQRVQNQAELAASARRVRALLDEERRYSNEVAQVRQTLAGLDRSSRRTFLAEGRLQASSHQVDGRRVYSLIGPEGHPIAYLDIPPGIDLAGLSSRRVGVRGLARYYEDLDNRLISVREIEPLDKTGGLALDVPAIDVRR
jgi:hypothetical protein